MTILTLPETLDRQAIPDLSEQILQHCGSAIILDAAAMKKISTLGIEMLIAMRHQWHSDGVSMEIRNLTNDALMTLERVGAASSLPTCEGQA